MSSMVQIRNVPSDVHHALKARAALEGMSLSEYLLRELRMSLERPTLDEIKARLAGRQPVQPRPAPAAAVRAERMEPLIVVDASAILEVLLQTTASLRINQRIFALSEVFMRSAPARCRSRAGTEALRTHRRPQCRPRQ